MRKTKGGVILLVACVVLLALQGGPAYAQNEPDHFKTYLTSGGDVNIFVALKDRFGLQQGRVFHLSMFSPPVEKEVIGGGTSPILDPEDHLTWYAFWELTPRKNILVTNQFGTDQEWVVQNTEFVLLPAQKILVNGLPTQLPPPVELDHYLCYNVVSGPPVGVDVNLLDQFHLEPGVTVGDPVVFCNPADKIVPDDGLPIYDNDNHLACYDINPKLEPPIDMVATSDQFADLTFDVVDPQFLCVPSSIRFRSPYAGTANIIAASYGRSSLIGSGVFNGLVLVFIPLGTVIGLRIWRRRK